MTNLNKLLMDGIGDRVRISAELQGVLARDSDLKLKLATISQSSVVALHPSARDRYLDAVARLHDALGADGESDAAKVIREVVETIVLHAVGPSRNRHTAPRKIEVQRAAGAPVGAPIPSVDGL